MSKRKIVVFDRVSVDGYFSSADGGLDWVVPDDEIDEASTKAMPDADTMLFGRATYQAFESYWPHALKHAETAEDPHAAGRRSSALRAMAVWINESKKIVFSKTLKRTPWNNTELIRTFDVSDIQKRKNEPGKDILVFGSGAIASLLTVHGLVDEYRFVLCPLLLGQGKSLIREVSHETKLELLEAKPYRSGNVVLHYAARK